MTDYDSGLAKSSEGNQGLDRSERLFMENTQFYGIKYI